MTNKTLRNSLTALLVLLSANNFAKNITGNSSQHLYFIENKGQIMDQYQQPRTDIQYALQAPGMNIFIGNGQIHYQFTRTTVNYPNLPATLEKDYIAHRETDLSNPLATIATYRMDLALTGANVHAPVITADQQAYYENYYLTGCSEAGIQAHTCKKITYKNVYKDIDWVIYINGNTLEHEFVVGPGGNAADIKLTYNGQSSLKINDDGSITATTPMGVITEHAPVCYAADGSVIRSAFRLKNNELRYEAAQQHNMIIDPILEWGTYYGPDSNNTSQYGCVCDGAGNIYSCGLTYAPTAGNVATTGSFQAIYGGNCDAFLVKFDSSGNRVWGTYYGGTGGDWGNHVAFDNAGNIYLGGTTGSPNAIATAGCQQPAPGGGSFDAFLAKFSTAGVRQWGTYAGGTATDYLYSVACDAHGSVYISGTTDSYNNIATAGSFMPTHGGGHDDFLIAYNAAGVRQWGTYYGGNGDDFTGVVASDGTNVYLAGYTFSTTGVATPGTHQATLWGTSDAFITQFTATGVHHWGTYFGGPTAESFGGIACDTIGGVYLLGTTASDTGIATPGCFQPTRGGGEDAFLARINPDLGSVLWATYYGGPDAENVDQSRIVCDNLGNVFITGYTASTSGIASATGAWQTTYGGGDADAFLAKYGGTGSQWWSTYYGGSLHDEGRSCAFDGKAVYLCGTTTSPNNISTTGSFQEAGGTGPFYYEGFISKFNISDTIPYTLHTATSQSPTEEMSIYPNPNTGSFTLAGKLPNENGTARLSVTDITGKVLMNEDASVNNGILNKQIILNSIPSGTYFLRIVSQDKVHVLQFVKE